MAAGSTGHFEPVQFADHYVVVVYAHSTTNPNATHVNRGATNSPNNSAPYVWH